MARVLGWAAWGEKGPSAEAWERKREHTMTSEMSSVRERERERERGVTGEMSFEREREQKVKRE